MNLPNIISLSRMAMVPVTVWLILDERILAAFWLFLVAGLSDAVDGYLAKRFNAETVFGAFIDPLADKTLLVGTYITLGHEGYLSLWLVILVVFRDLLIVGGAILFQTLTHTLTMQPLMISKVNTAAQIVLAAVVLGNIGLQLQMDWLSTILMVFVAVTTLWSGAVYVVKWTKRATQMEDSS